MRNYNWWTDPANAEEVKRVSWWEHDVNKTKIELPVSIIEEDGYWCIAPNEETKTLIGDIASCSTYSSESREEVIVRFWESIKFTSYFDREAHFKYQRWVPFRRGAWKGIATHWFSIFGIKFYFRYGRNMKHGFYVLFTKLNIRITSDWVTYRNWEKNNPF